MDCSPSGSSVREILQAGILERVAISSSRGLSVPSLKKKFKGSSCSWSLKPSCFDTLGELTAGHAQGHPAIQSEWRPGAAGLWSFSLLTMRMGCSTLGETLCAGGDSGKGELWVRAQDWKAHPASLLPEDSGPEDRRSARPACRTGLLWLNHAMLFPTNAPPPKHGRFLDDQPWVQSGIFSLNPSFSRSLHPG